MTVQIGPQRWETAFEREERHDQAARAIQRLYDALVDDVMSLTDEEILEEIREDGLDPQVIAVRVRALIRKVIEAHR